MTCDKCQTQIDVGDEREYKGRVLCEDCYMDALSPVKACDPWAVYTAKSLSGEGAELTKRQKDILSLLKESNGMTPDALAGKLRLKMSELEREIAALRHMEKVRAAVDGDRKVICLW